VHQKIVEGWFGNESIIIIITALDPNIAHAQPSIYACFEDPADESSWASIDRADSFRPAATTAKASTAIEKVTADRAIRSATRRNLSIGTYGGSIGIRGYYPSWSRRRVR
jgi:hypothetical protein